MLSKIYEVILKPRCTALSSYGPIEIRLEIDLTKDNKEDYGI